MKIGQIVERLPETICEMDDKARAIKKPLRGRVVYIHPKGRYHTVEFELRGGKVRETFPGTGD